MRLMWTVEPVKYQKIQIRLRRKRWKNCLTKYEKFHRRSYDKLDINYNDSFVHFKALLKREMILVEAKQK